VNTIKDVAERAGVSIATVSRVFNDSSSVKSKTRDLVLQTARELAYSPNILARGLMRKKTETIGVVLPDLSGEFFSEVIRGIDEVAARRGYHILLSSSHSRLDDMERLLRLMAQGRVDGLLLMAPQLRKDLLPLLSTTKLPLVLLESSLEGLDADSYYIDNFRGAYLVVQHLIEHGHRRIAVIMGPEDNFDARERHKGYQAALTEKDIPFDGELAFKGDFQKRSGYFGMKRILSLDDPPTAVFAANDDMAIGAMEAAKEAKKAIPEDIAIVGFDDIPISRYVSPRLTTVHMPIYEMVSRATERVINRIEEAETGEIEKRMLSAGLMVRQSCGCSY